MSQQLSSSRQANYLNNIQQSKKQYSLNFIQCLIQNPLYRPFINFDDLSFGLFDVQYITKQTGLSLLGLREELMNKKHFSLEWFMNKLNKIYTQVSDYILLDDPLQTVCQQGLRQISNFKKEFKNFFSKKGKKQEIFDKSEQIIYKQNENQKVRTQKKKTKIASFKSQLQMNDEQIMRKIGEVCQILNQNQQYYVFDLSKNCIWQAMIDRSSNN